MEDKELVLLIKRVSREIFWEVWDTELLPVVKDFVGVRLDVSRAGPDTVLTFDDKPKSALPEFTFDILKWEDAKGARLGDYQVAYRQQNIGDKWQHCFNILKANNATIANSFHLEGYVCRYWIFPDKYLDQIFRKRLVSDGSA